MHDVINQLFGLMWVMWMPLWYLAKTRSKHVWLDILTHLLGYLNTHVWKSICKRLQYLNKCYSNQSLLLTLHWTRWIVTSRLISHFPDELCKPDVQGNEGLNLFQAFAHGEHHNLWTHSQGFQTLKINKSTRPSALCFHRFSSVGKPQQSPCWFVDIKFKEYLRSIQAPKNEFSRGIQSKFTLSWTMIWILLFVITDLKLLPQIWNAFWLRENHELNVLNLLISRRLFTNKYP